MYVYSQNEIVNHFCFQQIKWFAIFKIFLATLSRKKQIFFLFVSIVKY